MSDPQSPAPDSRGAPIIWMAVFALVTLGLIVSIVVLISADRLPARFIDADATQLVHTEQGSRLHLVLRHAPRHGQLHTEVIAPTDGGPTVVEVRLSATGAPAPAVGEDDRRTIDLDLPRTDRVRIIDLRWGREEGLDVEAVPQAP